MSFNPLSIRVWCCLGLMLLACGEPEPITSDTPLDSGGTPAAGGNASSSASGAPVAGAAAGGAAAPNAGAAGIAGNAGAGIGATNGGANAGSAGQAGSSAGGAGGALGGSAGAGGVPPSCVAGGPIATVYTIGDSTMSVYDSKLYPRMGWGQPLGDLFDPSCGRVVDKALSGRSSKSFLEEGAWSPVKDALKSGDFVLIQFGHNDEKSENAALYTEPQTTYKQYLTTYVNDTRAKQANPVLLTSINRNSWNGTTLNDTHKGYPPAVRELAQSLDVPLIDLEALTREYFERIGPSGTKGVFLILTAGASPNYPDGVTDNTHLQEQGARAIGRLAMAEAYGRNLLLAGLLKGMPVAP